MTQFNKAYHISPEELQKLHEIQLELIAEVDRICKKRGIKYGMVGGTMLGAIRHKGYIPWDDDADIGFLREEYEKFREACKTELDREKFYMQDLRDTAGYRWGYGKLRRKDTAFIRLDQEFMPYDQGISIDLMPFDNVPGGFLEKRIHFIKCFIYRKLLWSEVGQHTEKNFIVRLAYKMMSCIPREKIVESYSEFISDCRRDSKTNLVRILTFPTPKGEGFFGYRREWYENLSEYDFENLRLPGAKDYDSYLKVKYGGYMKLPPENKRKIHPVSALKLLSEEAEGDEKV